MRTIKFKAKNKDNGEWTLGTPARAKLRGVESAKTEETTMFMVFPHSLTSECSACDFWVTACEVIPETISEFTGLCDRNGTEIYENDVVRWKDSVGGCCNAIIKFGKYGNMDFGFYLKWIEDIGMRPNLAYWFDKVEVVGNVFDNTDLLKAND